MMEQLCFKTDYKDPRYLHTLSAVYGCKGVWTTPLPLLKRPVRSPPRPINRNTASSSNPLVLVWRATNGQKKQAIGAVPLKSRPPRWILVSSSLPRTRSHPPFPKLQAKVLRNRRPLATVTLLMVGPDEKVIHYVERTPCGFLLILAERDLADVWMPARGFHRHPWRRC